MEANADRRRNCFRTFGKAFQYEWNYRHLGFSGAQHQFFPFAQWNWMDTYVYPIYHFSIAIGLVVWAGVEIPSYTERSIRENSISLYFIYATNWAFLTYMVTSFVFAIFCTFYNWKKEARVPKWLAEILWFFYGMSMNTVLVTSLVYWSAFWDPNYSQFYRPESRFKHTIPACTVLLDAWVNGLPIRLFHALYPMIFGIIYSAFSYLYYDLGNPHPIYPLLDWSKPLEATSSCLMTITLGLILQFVLYLIYVGRITLSAQLNGRGKVVVEYWWKADSKVGPVKEGFQAIEAVVQERMKEVEILVSAESNDVADVGNGYSSRKKDVEDEGKANSKPLSPYSQHLFTTSTSF